MTKTGFRARCRFARHTDKRRLFVGAKILCGLFDERLAIHRPPWRSPALLATLWPGLSGNLSQGHTLELSADRNTVQLQIQGTHNAAQLKSLVRTLAPLRAEMLPGVPADRDHQIKGGANTIMEKQPALSMAVLRGGGFRLT